MNDEEKMATIKKMLSENASYTAIARAVGYTGAGGLKPFCKRMGFPLPARGEFKHRAKYDDPEINRKRQEGLKAYFAKKKAEKQTPPPKKEEIAAHFGDRLATPVDVQQLASKFKVKGVPEKEKEEMTASPTPAVFQRFEKVPPNAEESRIGARIKCGKCGRTSVFRKHGTLSPDHVSQVFRNRGWGVGGGPRADRCPACTSGLGHHEVPEQPKAVVPPVQEQPKTFVPPKVTQPQIVAETKEAVVTMQRTIEDKPVDDMTRTDKRVIFAKLEEVYGDETTGYKGSWDDTKVATDLGIPTAWVALVREDTFGPEKNAETARLLAEVMALAELCRTQHSTLQTEVVALAEAVKLYQDNMATLEEKLAALK